MFSVDSETHYRTELRHKRIFHIRIICTALPYYITRYRSWFYQFDNTLRTLKYIFKSTSRPGQYRYMLRTRLKRKKGEGKRDELGRCSNTEILLVSRWIEVVWVICMPDISLDAAYSTALETADATV
jgi:hypothetical protein